MNQVMEDGSKQLKRWIIPKRNQETERRIQESLGISSLVACSLVNRGIETPEDAETYLNPRLDQLHDPKLLPDYEPAVKTILNARDQNQKIFIHGDYDVDGLSSTALLTRFLKSIGCDVLPHVPHRTREGYGIHLDAVLEAQNKRAHLFLTCDCGAKAHEQILAAKEAGMKVVVTDHHEISETLPEAEAIMNPHRKDSKYPFQYLSGAGVVFKLCEGLTEELGIAKEKYYRAYLDLATLGTVADVVPLHGENRLIVKHGLPLLKNSQKQGIQALLKVCSPEFSPIHELKASHIGFRLGPRLNAVGRIDEASLALDLLLSMDPNEARKLAEKLDEMNQQRRLEQQRCFEEALEKIFKNNAHEKPVIVVSDPNWHPGIIGLIASKLTDRFYKPSFVITADPATGTGKGSARTIPGFHLAHALDQLENLLLSGGGHEMAAGFSLSLENIEPFEQALHSYAQNKLKPEDWIPSFQVDAEVSMKETDFLATTELEALEPFGEANHEPLFVCRNVILLNIQHTRNPEHCRLTLQSHQGEIRQAMAFGLGNQFSKKHVGHKIDVLFSSVIDTYNGSKQLKWHIKDFFIR